MHWGALIVACGLLATMVTGEPDRAKYQIHMDRAKAAMATADYGMALSEYTLAADADPTNYMALYMRAMVQQATGRTKATLVDLARVLEMRPDFHQARVQRMEVHIKAYNLKEARVDLAELLRTFPTNEEYHEAERKMMSAETNLKAGKDADARGDYHNADRFYSFVIDVAPNYEEVRMLRGRVKLHKGEPESAVGDVARAAKLRSDNTQAYLLLTDIYYDLGELDEALKSIRECLKLDQSHPQCKPVYTKLKKLSKALNKAEEKRAGGDHHGAVERLKDALKAEREHPHYLVRTHKLICNSLLKLRRAQDAIAACNEALKHEPEDSEALCDTGEAHLLLELFQEALNFFQRAKQSDSGSHHIQQLLERTQRLIKQASRRDYYKILGLSRGCTKREVTKAYRSLALQWHPDKFDGEAEKKEAEKRFMDIAAAKEVLSDDDLRAIFDNGEDPLDAEEVQKRQQQQQHQHHFNPFGGGGGGGGQRFHFNFGG